MAAFLASLFGSIAGFFAQWMAKKTAVGLAAVGVLVLLTSGLLVALVGLGNALVVALPPEAVKYMSWVIPANTAPCVAAMVSAELTAAGYSAARAKLDLLVRA